jgi:dihydrolipoamide dehydrogenase
VLYLIKKNKIDHLEATAQAIDSQTIEVNNQKYTCDDMIIATGSKPSGLPLPGFAEAEKSGFLINSTGALSLPKVPEKLIIIGGGVIGVEFACLYSNLGTQVTLLQGLPTILEMLDQDISQEMTKLLIEKYGTKIVVNAKILRIEGQGVVYELNGHEQTISADYCLQSVGRLPVTTGFDNIGLDKTGRGYLAIQNEYCQTNLDNVYAIGDVNGRLMLAHVASHEGLIAANHIAMKKQIAGAEDLRMNFDQVPSCVYGHPEIAVVGKTEVQCQKEGLDYQAFKVPFSTIGKALADGHPYGFVKILIDKKYKSILGAHIIGNRATEMISEITAVMAAEGTIAELCDTITPHPTMSEAIAEAAFAL